MEKAENADIQIQLQFHLRFCVLLLYYIVLLSFNAFDSVRKNFLTFPGHFKLLTGHLIELNYGSLPYIHKTRWTCLRSSASFTYTAFEYSYIITCILQH